MERENKSIEKLNSREMYTIERKSRDEYRWDN